MTTKELAEETIKEKEKERGACECGERDLSEFLSSISSCRLILLQIHNSHVNRKDRV